MSGSYAYVAAYHSDSLVVVLLDLHSPPPSPPRLPPPPPSPPRSPPSPSPSPYPPGIAAVSTVAHLTSALANTAVAHIVLAPGTYYLTAELSITRSVVIQAAVAGSVVLNGGNAHRVLYVDPGSSGVVQLIGLNITRATVKSAIAHPMCDYPIAPMRLTFAGRRCLCPGWHSGHLIVHHQWEHSYSACSCSEVPIAPMGKLLTCLPGLSLAQLRPLWSTTAGTCRRDQNFPLPRWENAFLTCPIRLSPFWDPILFYQGYVSASHACKMPIAPMGITSLMCLP